MRQWPRWRAALRIARRDALRHQGRTALVVAMIGLPVLVVTGADTLYRTNAVTPAEALPWTMGTADARIEGHGQGPLLVDPRNGFLLENTPVDPGSARTWDTEQVAGLLPPGTRLVEVGTGVVPVATDSGFADAAATAVDLSEPLTQGLLTVLDGRAPSASDEVAVSAAFAERGVETGTVIEITRERQPRTVVGIVQDPTAFDRYQVLLPAGDPLAEERTWLADTPAPLDWSAVQALGGSGLAVTSRAVVENPPRAAEWDPEGRFTTGGVDGSVRAVLALVVACVLLEVVLLAGPAFAVGVRRQRRELGLLAATGASPADLRRVVLASGLVLGSTAAAAGAALGLLIARVVMPLVEGVSANALGPYEVSFRVTGLVLAVGAVAGLAAAWFPARQAARTDVVDALLERRGRVRTSWRFPALGAVLVVVGVAVTIAGTRGTEIGIAVGAVLTVVGLVTASPWLVGLLAPLADRLPTASRLAVRDATRHRSRTAPAVAAVLAAVAGITALAIGASSDQEQARLAYRPSAPMGTAQVTGWGLDESGWSAVQATVERELPGTTVTRVDTLDVGVPEESAHREPVLLDPHCDDGATALCPWHPPGGEWQHGVVVGGPEVLRALHPSVPEATLAALAGGRAVVLGHGALSDGKLAVAVTEYPPDGGERELARTTVPAVETDPPAGQLSPALAVIPPVVLDQLVQEWGLGGTVPQYLLVDGSVLPVDAEAERRVAEAVSATTPDTSVRVERGFTSSTSAPLAVLAATGGLVVLVAILTATGLALTDARPDFATLLAVGAGPRTRRRVAMAQAAVIAVTGALLGTLAGFVPGLAVTVPLTSAGTLDGSTVVDVPWLLLGAVTVGVPALAVAVAGLAAGSALPLTRRAS